MYSRGLYPGLPSPPLHTHPTPDRLIPQITRFGKLPSFIPSLQHDVISYYLHGHVSGGTSAEKLAGSPPVLSSNVNITEGT